MNSRGRRTQRRQQENAAARAEGRAPGWRERDREAQRMRDELNQAPINRKRRRAR